MFILIGVFFLLFGLIFFLSGGGISFISTVISENLNAGLNKMPQMIFAVVGLAIMVVGAILMITGFVRAKKVKVLTEKIFNMGVQAEATITFVDKNYSVLVNNRPIYSIIEFKFRDGSGREQKSRKTNVNSDLVIRLKLEVGSKVQVKYLNEDPGQNILILPDPNTTT